MAEGLCLEDCPAQDLPESQRQRVACWLNDMTRMITEGKNPHFAFQDPVAHEVTDDATFAAYRDCAEKRITPGSGCEGVK